MIEIIVEEQIDEAMSRKDQLKLALAKSKFKKSGGKIEVQPPSPSVGSNKYRGTSVATPKTKEDEKMAQDIKDYRKKHGKKDRYFPAGKNLSYGRHRKEDMSTASDIDMNPTGKKVKKKKYGNFDVSDEVFHKFSKGKTKFERWSKYLDLTDESQKKIYDWAKKNHNGAIILRNSTTGVVRGVRYNRTGGGSWGAIRKLKEQVLRTNTEFTAINEDVLKTLRKIVKDQTAATVKFDDKKTMKVDMQTANAIVTVFDALKKPNQEKFITMLNKGKATFSQIVGFAWKAVK
jgi:hypothetical protein|tara:strand:+ start:1585 stop:2451 length:867 start_codon:yes stop_codon:yes gene_type:complete